MPDYSQPLQVPAKPVKIGELEECSVESLISFSPTTSRE